MPRGFSGTLKPPAHPRGSAAPSPGPAASAPGAPRAPPRPRAVDHLRPPAACELPEAHPQAVRGQVGGADGCGLALRGHPRPRGHEYHPAIRRLPGDGVSRGHVGQQAQALGQPLHGRPGHEHPAIQGVVRPIAEPSGHRSQEAAAREARRRAGTGQREGTSLLGCQSPWPGWYSPGPRAPPRAPKPGSPMGPAPPSPVAGSGSRPALGGSLGAGRRRAPRPWSGPCPGRSRGRPSSGPLSGLKRTQGPALHRGGRRARRDPMEVPRRSLRSRRWMTPGHESSASERLRPTAAWSARRNGSSRRGRGLWRTPRPAAPRHSSCARRA